MKHLHKKENLLMTLSSKVRMICLLLAVFLGFAGTVSALTYNVTSTTDFAYTSINNNTGVITAGAGVGQVTLRSAIQGADALGGTHTINVPAGTYNLVRGSIIFGNVAQNISILGAGATTTVINMTTTLQDRIFFINPPGTIAGVSTTLQGLRFTGGRLTSDIYGGGAILAGGPGNVLNITSCTFDNNTIAAAAGTTGGAINMSGGGALNIDQSTFSGNSNPVSDGGAVYYFLQNFANLTGSMTITNSTFTNNTVTAAASNGGAIGFAAQGATSGQSFSVSIQRNTFTGNSAPSGTGGAIHTNNSFGPAGVVNINYNRIVGNSASNANTSGLAMASSAGSVTATNNWWGCNTGPTTAGCNRAAVVGSGGAGTLNTTTWLQLRHTASPTSICPTAFGPGNTSTLTASFLTNSAGTAIPAANLTALIGLPLTFNGAVLGTISAAQTTLQADGTATATFTSNGTPGTASANVVFVPLLENVTVTTSPTITVNAAPAVTTHPANVSLCGTGSATFSVVATGAGLSYQWQENTGSGFINASGASTGTSYTVNPATAAMNGYQYRVVVTGTCGVATSNNATLTVTNPPVVSAPTITQPTCTTPTATIVVNATGSGTLEYSINNGTSYQASATFTGVAPSSSNNIRVRLQGNPTCFTNYASNPVVINAVPTAPTVNNPATTTGTVGTAFSQTFTATGGLAPITFSTTSTLPTGLTLSTAGVLSGTPTQSGTFPIVVRATDANGCIGTGATYNLVISCQTITVTNPATATGTVGAAFSQTFTQTGGLGAITFSTTSTLPTGLTLSSAGVLSGTPTQSGTFPIVVRATDANGCFGNGPTYTLVISCQTITVTNPAVTTGQLSVPFSQTFTQTGGIGTVTFSTTSTLPTGLTLSGAGVLSGTPTQTGTFPIVVRVTDQNGCFANGPTYTLVINACPVITVTNPANATGTTGSPFSETFTSTGGAGAVTYTTTSTLPTGLTLSTAGVLSGTPTQSGTFPIVVTATDANSCTGNGPTYTLVINACIIDQTVTANPVTVCAGSGSVVTVAATQAGISYTLRNDADNSVVAGPIVGTGGPINFNTGNLSATTTYNVLAVKDDYSIYLDGGQAGFTIPHSASLNMTNDFTVEGWIKPDGNSGYARLYNKDGAFALGISSNQNQITFTRHGIGDYSSAYTFVSGQWYHIACTYSSSTVNFFVNGTPVGTTVAPLVNASTQPAHIGSDAGGNFNQFKGNIDNVRIWSNIRTQSQIAANRSAYLTSSGNPTLAASWWINEGSGFAQDYSSNGNNATAFAGTWQTPGAIPTCSLVLTNKPTVTVNAIPTVNPVADQVVCNGGATTAVTFSGAVAGTVYNWTNNTPSIGLAASGTGNIASFTATNTTAAPVTGMVTVTPSYTNAGVTCTGTPITFAITVNPTATVNTVANQTVCNNASTTAVTFSSPTAGGAIVYNWTNNTPSIGLAASGSGNIATFTATNATGAPVTATITVTPSYTNSITCAGTPTTFTITVNPTATVNAVANQTLCNTQSTTAVTFSSPTTGGTIVYNWTNNTPSIGLAASGTGNIASFTAVNTGTSAVVATITVTPAYTNGAVTCNGTPITFTITVNPPPAVTCPANISVNAAAGSCSAVVTYATSNTGGGTITYAFTGATTATGAGNGSGSAFNVGVTTVTVTTTSACGSSNCTFTVTVVDTQAPVITCPAQIVVCGSQVVNYPLPTVTDNCTVSAPLNLTQTASNTITPSNSVSCNNGAGHTANSYWRVYDLAALGLTGPYTVNKVIFGIESATAPSGSQPATIRLHTLTGPFTIANLTQVASQGITIPNQSGTLFTVNLTVPPTVPANAKLVVEVATPDGRPTSTLFYLGSNTGAQTAPNYISAPDCGVVNPIDVASVGYPNMRSVLNLEGTVGGSITPVQTAGLPSGSVFPVGTTVNTYTATDASGNTASCSFNVIVNPIPTVNAVSNQTVCNGDATAAVTFSGAVAGTVYNWTNNTPSIGLAASGTGNIASFTAVNLTNAAVTATITVTPSYTANGTTCTGTPITFTITVNPKPTVDPVANQVVCNGAPTTAVTFTGATAGTIFNWTNNTPSIGLAASGTGNIASFTATNATNAPVVATITVTPTVTGGATCPGTPITFTITVNPTPVVNAVANQVVCNGAPTTAVTFSSPSTGGTIVYNWTNNTTSIGLAASGSGNIASFNAINTGVAPVVATITVTPSYTNAGTTCTGSPITFTITVNPTPTVNAVANQVVCNGAPTTAITFTGAVAGTVYNWTNNTTSIGLAASGTGNIASFTATNTTNAPVVATITVTPSYTNAGTTCTGTARTFTITVNPTPTVNAVANQVTCHGALTTAVNFTGFVPGTVYSWTNNTTSIGLAASGTGNIPAFTATNTTLAPVVATITVTPSYTNGGTTCTGSPITFTITVNPTPTINPVPSQTVCNGAPTTPVVFTGNLAGTLCATANEGSNAVLTAPAGTVITGIVFASYGNPNGSCGAYTLGTCHATNSMSIVSSLAIGQTSVSIPADNGLFGDPCNGTAKRLYIQFTYGAPGASYSWTNNTPSIGLAAAGTGSIIPSFNAVNTGNAPVVATVTVTPTFTNGASGCSGTPTTFTITVNPTPIVNTVANQVVCNGAPTTAVTFSSPSTGGTIVYNWTNNNSTIGLAASGTGNIASFNAINTGAVPVTATISVTASYTNNGVTCTGAPVTFTITVNPTPSVNAIANQVVCNGAPTTAVNFTTPVPGTVFNWTNNTPSIGLAASGTGNIASFNAINTTNAPVVATITVTPTFTNGGVTCTGTARTFTITVNPTPTVNAVASQIVCNGAPTTAVTFSGFVPGTVYSWTNTTTSIGLAASGTGNIASFNAINTGTTPVIATITVTPSYTNGGVTCTGATTTFTITVNPTPVVDPVANETVCNNSPTTTVVFSSTANGGTIVYNWTNDNTSIGLGASGTGDIPSFIGTNPTNAPVTATITVTASYTNGGVTCTGPARTFTITVNPTPTVNTVASQVVCNNAPTTAINFSGAVAGTTFTWANNVPSIGLASSGTGNIASFTAINNGTAPVVATIVVTPVFTNNGVSCSGPTTSFTITVNPTPNVDAVNNQSVCNGAPTAAITFTGAVPGTVYSWTNNTTSIGLAASGTGNIASFTATNTTTVPVTATITVTPSYTNGGTTCSGTPVTFTITVNPTPTVAAVANQAVCNGSSTTAVNFSSTVPGTVFNWTNNNTSIGLAASGTGNIAAFTATNATNAAVTATITVTPTFTNGGTTCSGTPITFTITVNPVPTVNTVANQSVCDQSPTAAITFSGTVTGTVYNWTNNTPSIGLGASGTGNIPSFTATNATTAPVTATITVTPTYTNGGTTCTGSPTTFTITVTPRTLIATQPVSQTLCAGGSATFSVTATGTALNYQWQVNSGSGFSNIAGATNNTYTINPATAAMNGNQYQVIVTGTCGTVTSGIATLTVNTAPAITTQPVSAAVCTGSNATFTVAATGTALTYQWQINTGSGFVNLTNTAPYSGVTTATLTVSNVTAAMATHQFRVIITGTCTPPATSNTVGLAINTPVVITTQPASVTICFGPNATFSVVATGSGLTYQWQVNNGSGFVNIPGAVNPTLTVNNPGPVNFLQYRVIVTGACGSVISNTATLIVFALPSISLAQVPPRVCLTDTIVTLKANVAGGVWTGRGVSGDKFNPATAGLGASTITYTSTNANGCISVQSTTIVVNDCKERHNKLRDALRIYPNPSNGRFNIAFMSDLYKEFNLRVIDARGAVVKDFRFAGLTYGTVIPMNLTQLPAGMYILEAYNTQERAAFKIVITR